MSEIQSLTTEVNNLTASVNWWNTAIIVMMFVAALAAIGLVITQRIAFNKAERLSNAQTQLGIAKDKQLVLDLKEKDDLIAKANARGEEAKLEAAKLELKIIELKTPRRLTSAHNEKIITSLGKFPGTHFELSHSGHESLIFALDIESALSKAGWNVRSWPRQWLATQPPGKLFTVGIVPTEGVDIHIYDPSLSNARDALVNTLRDAGFKRIQGNIFNVSPESPDRHVMRIHVGDKP